MNKLKLIAVGFQIKTIYSMILFSFVMMVISENKVKAQQVQSSSSITLENVSYGNHPNQVIDFRKAKVDKPAPLVVFIHGGGSRESHTIKLMKMQFSNILMREFTMRL